ncbi:MAG: glutamate decarboxylase, partial [Cyanobium sp. MED195]|nr:glutamate decarboxylase [Cyanobium sp. MED195]
MALHQSRHHLRDSEEQALVDAMLSPLPKHHFPGEGREGNTTVQLLKEELLLDGN